jgi:hypothetical protein
MHTISPSIDAHYQKFVRHTFMLITDTMITGLNTQKYFTSNL